MQQLQSGTSLKQLSSFLFGKANKELLIFLIFFALSGIFWLSMTLNDIYEKEVRIAVRFVGIPKNVVLTSSETDTLRVVVRDRGTTMAAYLYGKALSTIDINFKHFAHNNGTGSVSASDLQKLVAQKLSASTKIVSVKPEKLTFYYNYGEKKRVPVKWRGSVVPEELYFIASTECKPDSITIYSSKKKLDSIHTVYTETLNYSDFRDSLVVSVPLAKISGVKMVPERTTLKFYTDVLTEETIGNVPVVGINMPEGKVLRTFPAKVEVRIVTGVSTFSKLSPTDFIVVADYNEFSRKATPKCNIYLRQVPEGITRASLSITKVDYLIEEREP